MAAAGATVQSSSDQSVIQQAARPKERELQVQTKVKEPKASLPVLLVVAGAVTALLWWRKRGASGSRGGKGAGLFLQAKGSSQTSTSSLPRNKQSTNNKKNMQRRKEEKQRRAEKRDRANSKQVDEELHKDPDDPNNHLVFNYSYYDSARRDHLHGPAQSQKKLGS
ncbi:TPA: hypothetical protein ACH3X2_001271 [Trebouxia sp. C0005]